MDKPARDSAVVIAKAIEDALGQRWIGLRSDLRLHSQTVDADGTHWMLEDPVAGSSYLLNRDEHRLFIALFESRTLAQAIRLHIRRYANLPPLDQLVQFLRLLHEEHLALNNEVTIRPDQTPKKPSPLVWLIFIRIPLLRPDKFLTAALPWLRWLWHPVMQGMYLAIAALAIAAVIPRYEEYFSSAGYLFTPQGAVLFALSLAVLKIGHEFAHAFTAKQQGLYVRAMGVALIALWPVLYTDTTEAWKLPDRKKRFHIDIAGICFELVIAAFALALWFFVPDGPLRNLLFFLSGISVATSLLINLNPLMRFDGYYLLMDRWGIDNLQPRAFALLGHKLRRTLWDWQGPAPEIHPQTNRMLGYATAAGLYRVIIALAIAGALYSWFHPLPGIIVFVLILWGLAVAPLVREGKHVWQNRKLLGASWRVGASLFVFALVLALLLIPFKSAERMPALLVNADFNRVIAPADATLTAELPTVGSKLNAEGTVVRLESAGLQNRLSQLRYDLKIAEAKRDNTNTAGEAGGYRNWLIAEIARIDAELNKLQEAAAQLQVETTEAAVVLDTNSLLSAGSHVAKDSWILSYGKPGQSLLHVYVHEREIDRISAGDYREASVTLPGFKGKELTAQLQQRRDYPVDELPNDALYDFAGGPIPSRGQRGEDLAPRDTWYVFVYKLEAPISSLPHGTPVTVSLGSAKTSILGGWFKSIGQVLAREGIT